MDLGETIIFHLVGKEPPVPVVVPVAILLYRESPLEILEKMLILLAAGLSISPCSAGD